MQDAEAMTLGMWIDYVVEWNNIHLNGKNNTEVKRATQADYNVF